MADNVADSMHKQIVVANVIGMAMRADQISNVRRCQTVSGQSCRCAVDAMYGIVLKILEGMHLYVMPMMSTLCTTNAQYIKHQGKIALINCTVIALHKWQTDIIPSIIWSRCHGVIVSTTIQVPDLERISVLVPLQCITDRWIADGRL